MQSETIEIRSIDDYIRFKLADLEGMHAYPAELTLRVAFGLDQLYPNDELGLNRIMSAASLGTARGTYFGWHTPAILQFPKITAFSNRYFGDHLDLIASDRRERTARNNGVYVRVREGNLAVITHELLHAVFHRAELIPQFMPTLANSLAQALGFPKPKTELRRWSIEPDVRRAISKQIGGYAATSFDEVLAEACTAGILQGNSAPPVARAVREVLDQFMRFDAIGSDSPLPFIPLDIFGRHAGQGQVTLTTEQLDLDPTRVALRLDSSASLRDCLVKLMPLYAAGVNWQSTAEAKLAHRPTVVLKSNPATEAVAAPATYLPTLANRADYEQLGYMHLNGLEPESRHLVTDLALALDLQYRTNLLGICERPISVVATSNIISTDYISTSCAHDDRITWLCIARLNPQSSALQLSEHINDWMQAAS